MIRTTFPTQLWAALCSLLVLGLFFAGQLTAETAKEATPDQAPNSAAKHAWVLDLTGVIGPASSDHISRGIQDAAADGASMVIITLDTPGGLDKSMRTLIQAIIASPIPVVTFVFPQGARAASAGTYILYASHIAAMAPATNLGAATPVAIGAPGMPSTPKEKDQETDETDDADAKPASPKSALERKAINDAVAYIRSLAELRGRNAEWAEQAVRQAASLSAEQALAQQVIDLMASDLPGLLQQLDGRQVETQAGLVVMQTQALRLKYQERDWRTEFLAIITNPNVAYILMLLGVYGLLIEFYNPGVGLPGIVGAISLLLGLYAFQLLPVSYAGLGLMLLGLALMTAEALSPSFGLLGMGGLVAFAFGSVLLMDTRLPGFQIAWPVIAAFTVSSAIVCIFVLAMALRARRQRIASGTDLLIGMAAEVVEAQEQRYRVRVEGEVWAAECDAPLRPGNQVRIEAVDGLRLRVSPLKPELDQENSR